MSMPSTAEAPQPGAFSESLATAGAGLLVAGFCALFLIGDPGWFWLDDYQSVRLANYCDVARAWRAGELPLLSPYSWEGGALAGEYQAGVFSVALTGGALVVFGLGLPLPLAAAALSIGHLAVLAAGTFRLGRCRGLPRDLAVLAALVTSLSGWTMIWGARIWFEGLASFAWVPWFWWGLYLALDRRRGLWRLVPASVFLYLINTGGQPFTTLLAFLPSLWLSLRRSFQGPGPLWAWPVLAWVRVWPIAAVWLLGLGLSAPAWMMLREYLTETWRSNREFFAWNWEWTVPPWGLPGLIYPGFSCGWNVFSAHPGLHLSSELAGGLVPVALLLGACRRPSVLLRNLWEFGLLLLTLGLCMGPGFWNFRWSFRWLPLFFLVLGLTAAQVQAAFRTRPPGQRGFNSGLVAVVLAGLAWAAAAYGQELFTRLQEVIPVGLIWEVNAFGPLESTERLLVHGSTVLALCLVWAAVERWAAWSSIWRRWLPAAVVLGSVGMFYAGVDAFLEVPTWDLDLADEPAAQELSVRYLSFHTHRDIFRGERHEEDEDIVFLRGRGAAFLPGNSSLYAGIEFINGYSPNCCWGLTSVIDIGVHGDLPNNPGEGEIISADLHYLLTEETRPGGLLQLMAVDGLVVANRFASLAGRLQKNGWRQVEEIPEGAVYHRLGRPSARVYSVPRVRVARDRDEAARLLGRREQAKVPWVLLVAERRSAPEMAFATPRLGALEESRLSAAVAVRNPDARREALVVFARPWYPGYVATLDGEPLPVERFNLFLPAVRVPPGGTGRLVLEYRPRSFVRGCTLAAAAGSVMMVLLVLSLVWRRRPSWL
jgi:hypothetical protein